MGINKYGHYSGFKIVLGKVFIKLKPVLKEAAA